MLQLRCDAAGSPADKADLEVADEILEINGESLANSTHTDVISHIHNVCWPKSCNLGSVFNIKCTCSKLFQISFQCIKSRTICLRVKRRTGNKLGK